MEVRRLEWRRVDASSRVRVRRFGVGWECWSMVDGEGGDLVVL